MSISTKWFFTGSFAIASLVGYLGGFSASSFFQRQLGNNTELSEINISEKEQTPSSRTPNQKNTKTNNKRSNIQPERMITSIVRRSIFDSSKADFVPEEPVGNTGEGVMSTLDLTLIATIIATPEEFSIALIKENNSGVSMTYGVGFEILGEATITKIEKDRVYFQRTNSDQLEYIEIGGEKSTTAVATTTEKKGEDGEVQKVGANKFIVEQAVLDEIMANPEKLYTQVRVTPYKDDAGTITGYRMTGIRRNSIFYKLGVKNGDIVHSVNGQPLTSLSSAMDAYNSLGSSKNFNFEITRRKDKQTFEYEVR